MYGTRSDSEIDGNVPDRPFQWRNNAEISTGTPETGSRCYRGFSNIISPSGRPVGNVPVDFWSDYARTWPSDMMYLGK